MSMYSPFCCFRLIFQLEVSFKLSLSPHLPKNSPLGEDDDLLNDAKEAEGLEDKGFYAREVEGKKDSKAEKGQGVGQEFAL